MRLHTMYHLLGQFFLTVQFGMGEIMWEWEAEAAWEGERRQTPFSLHPSGEQGTATPLLAQNLHLQLKFWGCKSDKSLCYHFMTQVGQKMELFLLLKPLPNSLRGHRHGRGSVCSSAYAGLLLLIIYRSPGAHMEHTKTRVAPPVSCFPSKSLGRKFGNPAF